MPKLRRLHATSHGATGAPVPRRSVLELLPDDVLRLLARRIRAPADQRAFALTCTFAASLVRDVCPRTATLTTSVLIDRPALVRANYMEDVATIFSVLSVRRLRKLRSLRLDIDSPVLLAGGRRKNLATMVPPTRETLVDLSVSLRALENSAAIVHVGARATARLLRPWSNLQSLTLQSIPNLCITHFEAMTNMRLTSLALDRCRCSPVFQDRLSIGLFDGRFLPKGLVHLHFDVYVARALWCFMRYMPERTLLGALTRLQTLHMSASLDDACQDPWWLAQSLLALTRLQTVTTDSDLIVCACHVVALIQPEAQRVRVRKV